MSGLTTQEIAERWAEGLAGDYTTLDKYGTADMRVWHSSNDHWLDKEEQRVHLEELQAQPVMPVLADTRWTLTESGFLVQGVIEGATRTHIIQVCTVVDGQVTEVEEYIAPELRS